MEHRLGLYGWGFGTLLKSKIAFAESAHVSVNITLVTKFKPIKRNLH